ncbi:RNA polymerase sigma-70 factor (ECF subfamily) [Novosphingobium gossypii]
MEMLYRRERSRLLGFVRTATRNAEAEDVVHRSFTRLLEREEDSVLERPEAYLRRTARNIIIDDARREIRSSAALHVPAEDTPLCDGDPVAALEARDRLRRIEEAVSRLKPLTRQIFIACRVDGFSHAEVASQTGLSIKGVEKQMGKAIKQLSRHLRAHD